MSWVRWSDPLSAAGLAATGFAVAGGTVAEGTVLTSTAALTGVGLVVTVEAAVAEGLGRGL